jgi:hypothetical protein
MIRLSVNADMSPRDKMVIIKSHENNGMRLVVIGRNDRGEVTLEFERREDVHNI